MRFIQSLFAHYKAYHLHGPLMLRYAGILGAVGFPLFYALRFTKSSMPYDDLVIRVIAASLCLLLVLKNRWPDRLKPYYIAFSYPAMIFSLPVAFVFTSLKNGGGAVAVGNTLMAAFFVMLITDWRNTIAMLVAGIGTAVLLYVALDPDPRIPADYVARLPMLILVVIGGSLFKYAGNQAAAEKMRQAYASIAGSIAHEMRNPLGQLKHSLEGMQRALPLPTTVAPAHALGTRELDDLYRYLAQSDLAVKRGLQVIAMTLDEVNAKPVDTAAFSYLSAAEATGKAVQEYVFESAADRDNVNLRVVGDFSFRGDETAYLFVLFNLIKNALYYLPAHPNARVTITVGHHQVRVHDTGPGVPADVLARLFQPFNSAGKSGGTGLGLAYCRRVMRAFGGDISCESVLGAYTEFILRFPPVGDKESETYRANVLERARTAFAGKRLLIVDDDAAQRITTRHKLAPLDVQVDQAADGARALEALVKHRYDLVLLDLNMPVLDGYAVATRIRQGEAPANRNVRIVAYTNEPAHLASVKTQKAGMDGFVSKPCAQLPLVQALHHALDHPRAEPDPMLAGRRVLLADDNPYNRKAVAAYLKQAGATVLEASHGDAVLAHLRLPERCDAILMDINMPGMNGLETTQAIRGSGMPGSDVPIIALTAHSDQAMLGAAREAGMDGFITKPVEAAMLYQTLRKLVSGGRTTIPAVAVRRSADTHKDVKLLDLDRLESYRRIGMLDELLSDYVPEIARLVARLENSVANQDLPQALDALHSLLGMSGEAGGAALYQTVRAIYVPMVETRSWPAQAGWLEQISAITLQTEHALKAHTAAQAAG